MSRRRGDAVGRRPGRLALAAAVVTAAALAGSPGDARPRADDARRADDDGDRTGTEDSVRGQVLAQLGSQRASIAQAAASVQAKLDAAHQVAADRARVAARLLGAGAAAEPLDRARRRAAVGWVLGRERGEVGLLSEERGLLAQADARIVEALRTAAVLPLPPRTLSAPADGEVVRPFGRMVHERSGATLARRGVELEVKERASARALADGVVVHAGPIRGLGRGVLVEHGGYWTLVAKLGEVKVAVGQRVDPSTVLGEAARRRLYVELRLNLLPAGLPIDPMPFLAGGAR